jgi:hypothetical protein
MPCGKYKRIRTVDVGRPGHHYVRIGVIAKAGPRGGHTQAIGKLKTYKKGQCRTLI